MPDKFLAQLALARLDDQKLVFNNEINDTNDKIVFIRPCYRELYEMILPNLKSNEKCIVTGTPGIGKSMFSYYMLHRLLAEGISVIYIRFGWTHCHLFLAKTPSVHVMDILQQHEITIQKEHTDGWLGQFVSGEIKLTRESSRFYTDLIGLKGEVVVIVDPPRIWGADIFENPPCGLLVVTSPTPDRTSSVRSQGNAFTWFMPLWSQVEMRDLIRVRKGGADLTELEEAELQLREMRFGEVPRYIAQVKQSHLQMIEIAENETMAAITALNGPTMAHVVDPTSTMPQVSGRIIHMDVTHDQYKRYQKKFASEMIERQIIVQFHRAEQQRWIQFASAVSDINGFTGMVGVRSEIWWHGTLQAGKEFTLEELFMKTGRLNSTYKKSKARQVTIMESGARYSAKQNLSDIKSLHDFVGPEKVLYFHFLKGNVPAIDALWVFHGSVGQPIFDPGSTSPPPPVYVCGVQMTLSKKHSMNITGMDTFMNLVKTKAPAGSSVQLIFITDEQLNRDLHYIQINQYNNLRQWLIKVPPGRIFH